jgi:peroxiredoxin
VRIAALFMAVAAALLPLPGDNVEAADTILKPAILKPAILKPWTGGQLPLFTLKSLTGEPIDLAQVQTGAVLVHFSATWCEACRLELAALRLLHDHLAGESVTIIGVDAGEVAARVRRFFAQVPAPFCILLDSDETVSKAWQVSVLPTTVLLDGDLTPRLVAEGDLDWAQPEIEQLVTSLSQQKPRGKVDRASLARYTFEEEANVDRSPCAAEGRCCTNGSRGAVR